MAINLSGWNSPHHIVERAGIIVGAAITGTATLAGFAISSLMSSNSADKANALARENMNKQNDLAREALKDQRAEAAKLEKQKDIYRSMEFTNPYEDMDNFYEDLTVNQEQANFEKQMFQQSQANTMQGLRGAAGGSGIAGLAQVMANQGQQASRQASLSIGQQERANELARLGEAKSNDIAFRGGEASVEEKEMNRQSTLLGMQMGQLSGANAAVMQTQQNQMAAGAAQANLYGQQAASQSELAGQMISTGMKTVGGMLEANAAKTINTECFIKNSKVLMSDGTLKNIQDVRAGSIVQGEHGENVVKKLIKHAINDVYRIYTNGLVNTTADHPLFINSEWTSAEELGWGSELTYVDNLYNLETESTFVVDGVTASGVLSEEFKQI